MCCTSHSATLNGKLLCVAQCVKVPKNGSFSQKNTNHQSAVHFLGIRGEESDSVPVIPYFPENICCGKNNVIRPFEKERTQLFECVSSAAPPCVKIQIPPPPVLQRQRRWRSNTKNAKNKASVLISPFYVSIFQTILCFLRFCGKGRDTYGEKHKLYFT